MKKEKSSIIYNLETVAVFRNGSRRQGLLELRLKDPVFAKISWSIFLCSIRPIRNRFATDSDPLPEDAVSAYLRLLRRKGDYDGHVCMAEEAGFSCF